MRTVLTMWLVLVLAAFAASASGCARPRQPQMPQPAGSDANAIDVDWNSAGDLDSNMSDDVGADDGAQNASADANDLIGGEEFVLRGATRVETLLARRGSPRRTEGEEWCGLLDRNASASHCEALRRQLGSMQRRVLELEAPAEMIRDETVQVQALLRKIDAPARRNDGRIVRGRAEVMASTVMIARLSGDGFDIDPPGWNEIDAGPERVGRWEWRVTPRGDREERTLHVIARPRLTGAGGPSADLEEYEDSVTVRVQVRPGARSLKAAEAVKQQSESWAKALGALAALVTALGVLYAAIRKLVRPAKKGDASAPATSAPGEA